VPAPSQAPTKAEASSADHEPGPRVAVQRLAKGGCAQLEGGDWLCPTDTAPTNNGCAVARSKKPVEPQAPPGSAARLTCELGEDGAVFCSGSNPEGGLGDGRSHVSVRPVRVKLPRKAGQVATGSQHACALLEDRSVWCWGENSRGALGLGILPACCDLQDPARPPEYLTPQPLRSLPPSISVHAFASASCALTEAGEVYCWGENGSGELGSPPTPEPLASPTRVVGLPSITQLIMDVPSCALSATRDSYCWGDGCPLPARSSTPVKIDWAALERPSRAR
jgi:hypothetical protein